MAKLLNLLMANICLLDNNLPIAGPPSKHETILDIRVLTIEFRNSSLTAPLLAIYISETRGSCESLLTGYLQLSATRQPAQRAALVQEEF